MGSSKIQPYNLDNSVFSGIVEMMQELKTDIATMKDSLATKSDMSTLQSFVSSALEDAGGAVAKIQRGTLKLADYSSSNVTLSGFTDLNKMHVTLNGVSSMYGYNQGFNGCVMPYVKELELNKLVIGQFFSDDYSLELATTISYEVIQYK